MNTTTSTKLASSLKMQLLNSSNWFNALTLDERAAIQKCRIDKPSNQEVTSAAKLRFEQWRAQPPFASQDHFTHRLAIEGLDDVKLLQMLSEDTDTIRYAYDGASQSGTQLPKIDDWLQQLVSGFSQASDDADVQKSIGTFLNVVRPLIVQGFKGFQCNLDNLEQNVDFVPYDRIPIEDMLLDQLAAKLERILGPTLVLELNVARVEDRLAGETPDERYADFIRSLMNQDVSLAILAEYPVAARLVVEEIERWRQVNIELIERLIMDWHLIIESFNAGMDIGKLISIQCQAGDCHRGGRSVAVIEFSSGLKLVYKPRSLALDLHFQQLLEWFNERSQLPRLRILKVENRGAYGWVEFAKHLPCRTEEEVRRFYQRHGAYLAILYILAANDMHSENIIACGEHPVPIDVETLFQPLMPTTNNHDPLLAQYHRAVERSVLKSNLLPRIVWAQGGNGIDISGIGGKGGQKAPDSTRTWSHYATDEMRVVRESFELPEDRNRPALNETAVDASKYSNEVVKGFESAYDTLLSYQVELLDSASPLQCFRKDESRVVLRDTRTYAILLRESFHPDLMRCGLLRDRHFDRLWARAANDISFRDVVAKEQTDLRKGDVPVFTTSVDKKSLIASDGTSIENFFLESGWREVCDRILQLGSSDKLRQLTLLRSSLGQLVNNSDHLIPIVSTACEEKASESCLQSPNSMDHIATRSCDEVVRIVELLEANAIGDGTRSIWTGLMPKNNGWVLAPTATDLYSGLPGIAMFLAYAGSVLNEPRATRLANSALVSLLQALDSDRFPIKSVGAYSGWGGIIYALSHLGTLWGRDDLIDRATDITRRFPELIDKDVELDIIGGSAGCIASCISLYACHPSDHLLEIVERCGSKLLDCAQPSDGGIGWYLKDIGDRPLTGFSHGAAGFAWALERAFEVTGVERFRDGATAAMHFERQHFCQQQMNWLDYRSRNEQPMSKPSSAVTWCHGAPGIGLARISMKCFDACEDSQREVDIAIQTTLTSGFGINHCLCHGDLGNLELLLQVLQQRDDQKLRGRMNTTVAAILENAESHGWLCGVPHSIPVPGIMTGLAGIGYQLLRIAKPNIIPSILTLDPPVSQ